MSREYETLKEAARRLGKDRGWFQKKIYEGRVADKEGRRPFQDAEKRWKVPVGASVLPPHPRSHKWPEAKRKYYRIKQREHRERMRKQMRTEERGS